MKKLMSAAVLALSMCAGVANAAPESATPPAVPAEARQGAVERQKMTPEQRKAFYEKMQAARRAHQVERLAKVTEALKEAGLTDEQAKTVADKIEKIYTEGRRGGPRGMGRPARGPQGQHRARPAAPAKPVAAE